MQDKVKYFHLFVYHISLSYSIPWFGCSFSCSLFSVIFISSIWARSAWISDNKLLLSAFWRYSIAARYSIPYNNASKKSSEESCKDNKINKQEVWRMNGTHMLKFWKEIINFLFLFISTHFLVINLYIFFEIFRTHKKT